ncbi:hypothetical protein BJX63DRAFT_31696 [Aspergillus granulosus]|uniref:Uncharacterized protein n=1 Tax=Aspergillus granulosus TaxID=176169 RepID=A0ABR4HUP9_9EURO
MWHHKAMLQLRSGATLDSEFYLALAGCHALLVFLSNNYNYYQFWHDVPAPRLSQEELSDHVESILQQADHVLKASDVSSVLLLFPLRVAGTHAENGIRARILGLLDCVFARGFVVSRRIKDDLHEYWDDKDSLVSSFDPL